MWNNTKLLFSFLLAACLLSGCQSFNRNAYIQRHSLDAFMRDRTQAAQIIRQHPALEAWLNAEWSRPVDEFQIIWQKRKPIASPAAESVPLPRTRVIAIHVSKSMWPADQVLCLCFETCNARGWPRFRELNDEAFEGKISRAGFVDGVERTEFTAVLRLKECFPKLLPASDATNSYFYPVLLAAPDEFEKYKKWQVKTHDQNYLAAHKKYGSDFDRIVKLSHLPAASGTTNALPPLYQDFRQ